MGNNRNSHTKTIRNHLIDTQQATIVQDAIVALSEYYCAAVLPDSTEIKLLTARFNIRQLAVLHDTPLEFQTWDTSDLYRCPRRIIAAITGTPETREATAWLMANSRDRIPQARRLLHGEELQLAEAIIFADGHAEADFIAHKPANSHRLAFRSKSNGRYYKISNYRRLRRR